MSQHSFFQYCLLALFTHFTQPQYNHYAVVRLFDYLGRRVALFLRSIAVDTTMVQPRCSSHQHSRKLSCRVEQEHNMLANLGLPAVCRWWEGYGSRDGSSVLHANLLQFTQGEEANCNCSVDCGLRNSHSKPTWTCAVVIRCIKCTLILHIYSQGRRLLIHWLGPIM